MRQISENTFWFPLVPPSAICKNDHFPPNTQLEASVWAITSVSLVRAFWKSRWKKRLPGMKTCQFLFSHHLQTPQTHPKIARQLKESMQNKKSMTDLRHGRLLCRTWRQSWSPADRLGEGPHQPDIMDMGSPSELTLSAFLIKSSPTWLFQPGNYKIWWGQKPSGFRVT